MSIKRRSAGGSFEPPIAKVSSVPELECTKFYPPLLSAPSEFCNQVIAKGLPISKCQLTTPGKLVIEVEPPPIAKPSTSRSLKNWQRWCYIWRKTYNTLAAKRNTNARPPVMGTGEVHGYKREDQEVFDRTVHSYHLTGYYVKNAIWPDSIRHKACGTDKDITEVITKRYARDFPEMKRQRYPNLVRNEASLPIKKTRSTRRSSELKQKPEPPNSKWEEQWTHMAHVADMKDMLDCDIASYGKPDPHPDNLIMQPLQGRDVANPFHERRDSLPMPQLVITKDSDDEVESLKQDGSVSHSYQDDKKSSNAHYNEFRGPVLRLRSRSAEVVLRFSPSLADGPHFIKNPSDSGGEAYLYDDNQHFAITTKCKDVKFIVLKNEGTAAIRYQWFRYPPSMAEQSMLADTTEYKHLTLSKALDREKSQENLFFEREDRAGFKVPKKSHLEFHFSELPGVILPGQSLDFPIIFRSKRPGYFHETLYLLTHPKLKTHEGRYYAVGLSGICVDLELEEKGNEKFETEGLKRYLSEKKLAEESTDLMDSILDQALSKIVPSSCCSLPDGRVTAESVFSAHNKHFYYHCGKSEKALELVRQVTELIVPKTRVDHLAECHLSIQSLHNLVTTAKDPDDLYWSQLCSSQAEDLLSDLHDHMLTLSQQRIFSWPSTDRRKYTACYSNAVVTFDEILRKWDRLHNYHNAGVMRLIDGSQAEELVGDYYYREDQILNEPPLGEVEEQNIEVPVVEEVEKEKMKISVDPFDHGDGCSGEFDCYWLTEFEQSLLDSSESPAPNPREELPSPPPPTKKKGSPVEDAPVADTAPVSDTDKTVIWKPKPVKPATVMTLQESMRHQVKDERRQVMTETRVQLFEDMMCDALERMLATVDSFNNMLDYGNSDAVLLIDDSC